MKKNYWLLLTVIILVAVVTRFYKLGDVPHGMTWDEAAIGYNGYAVLTTRRDEWLKFLPISFWSFGDYKAPAAIYINGFFTFLFGMNLFAVRLPFAIASIFAILGFALLIRILLKQEKKPFAISPEAMTLLGALLMTLSPWHIHYSRAGFESGLALSLLIWGVFTAFWSKTASFKNKFVQLLATILPSMFFVASMYTYHSTKIVVPLLVISIFLLYKSSFLKNKSFLVINCISGFIVMLPMIYDSIFGNGLERSGTLIFSQEENVPAMIKAFFHNIYLHLEPSYLLLGETTTLRHGTGKYGIFFIIPFIFILLALGRLVLYALNKKRQSMSIQPRLYIFSLVWIILGLLPGVLASEAPHSNRTLVALPGFLLLAVLGFTQFIGYLQKQYANAENKKFIIRAIVSTLFLVYVFTFLSFINHYFSTFAAESASAFQDGYLEAFEYVIPYEKGEEGRQQVEKIVFTSEYGQPYIYALFARETNPIWYQGGSLIKYEFRDDVGVGDLSRENAVVVAGQKAEFLDQDRADKVIYGSDGEPRFLIYVTK